jgi:hypothetical protein
MSPSYDRNHRLIEADPRPLGQRIPNPLHERVDELCDVVYRAGHARPTKVRMLAAVLLAAPTDPATLDALLRAFDRATVGDALVAPGRADGNVIRLPERKSGPRSGRSA